MRLQVLEAAKSEAFLKDKKATDDEVRAEYDKRIASMPKTQYKARHILVGGEDAAKSIIAQLRKGAKFEDLAKAQSLDSSKSSGGDLGWFNASGMVKPFADAVAALKKGEVTATPVKTEYGWHVIRLDDTRDTPVPPLDQVKHRSSSWCCRASGSPTARTCSSPPRSRRTSKLANPPAGCRPQGRRPASSSSSPASPRTRTPSVRALSSFEPASAPAIR